MSVDLIHKVIKEKLKGLIVWRLLMLAIRYATTTL